MALLRRHMGDLLAAGSQHVRGIVLIIVTFNRNISSLRLDTIPLVSHSLCDDSGYDLDPHFRGGELTASGGNGKFFFANRDW